jgi:RNA recognition motif-containing protein
VGNLSYQVTSAALEQLFAPFGTVQSAEVIQDRDTGSSKGFGFVEMSNGADEAIRGLNDTPHEGRPLIVNEARPRENRNSRGRAGNFGRRY